jgi:hypothetical protein
LEETIAGYEFHERNNRQCFDVGSGSYKHFDMVHRCGIHRIWRNEEKGAIIGTSTKQKVNLRSSAESELIGVDDKIAIVLWMKGFLEWQDFAVKVNIIYQDNTSTIKLEEK